MTTLTDYLKEAEKLIGVYGFNWLLNDSNNVGEVARSLMEAESKFNGTGTLKGYRVYRAKCKMKQLSNPKRKTEQLPQDETYEEKTWQKLEIMDVLDKLHYRLADVLYQYYYLNRTYSEIGDSLGVGKQRVHQLMTDAKKNFKVIYEQD